jgi:hypothetical protein
MLRSRLIQQDVKQLVRPVNAALLDHSQNLLTRQQINMADVWLA